MCEACDTGNKKLLTLSCNNCKSLFYLIDDPNEVEDKTCPSCRVGIGSEWSDADVE